MRVIANIGWPKKSGPNSKNFGGKNSAIDGGENPSSEEAASKVARSLFRIALRS